jgi:cyclic-di-GMP-binding biofilm dispersal mediator protein
MASTRDLRGAVVAVVGANGGLGREIAAALVRRNAVVVRCTRSGGPDSELTIDLRDARAGDALVEHVTATHGRLDGVVVAAGLVAFGDLVDTDDVVIEELFLTNAMGPMWLAKRVAPALQASQGFFVNLSGVVAETPMPGMAAYSASKAAAVAATEAIRREFRRMKVAVIDVRPPHTETGLATRPLAGTAPTMPTGLEPAAVAERIVAAIERGDTAVASTDF